MEWLWQRTVCDSMTSESKELYCRQARRLDLSPNTMALTRGVAVPEAQEAPSKADQCLCALHPPKIDVSYSTLTET